MALYESTGLGHGAVVAILQHRLVRRQERIGGDRIRQAILQHHLALQAQVRGGRHLDHMDSRRILELEHIARRFRQRPGQQQIFQARALRGQGRDLADILRAQQGTGVLHDGIGHVQGGADAGHQADCQGQADIGIPERKPELIQKGHEGLGW